jgi:hypothetical protein
MATSVGEEVSSVPGRPNKVNPGAIWLATMDPRNGVLVETGQNTLLCLPEFPGMEIALPD